MKHDVDVRFFTGSGNTAVSRMRNASGHNYWNSSFIIDMAMGQIPRSTERISSYSCVLSFFNCTSGGSGRVGSLRIQTERSHSSFSTAVL